MPSFSSSIVNPRDTVEFTLRLVAGRQYIVDVLGGDPSLGFIDDPKVVIFDENGDQVAANDDIDFPNNKNSQTFLQVEETQDYRFEVTGFGTSTGRFDLDVFRDDFRAAPVGHAPIGTVTSKATGRIDHADDADAFKATFVQGLTYQISLLGSDTRSGSLDDPFLKLIASSGETLEDDNSGKDFNARLLYTASTTSENFIIASGVDSSGTYEIKLSQGVGTEDGDTLVGSDAADRINAAGGEDRVSGGEGDDTIKGGADADRLRGNDGADVLFGGGGNDQLRGDAGRDILRGGSGEDRLIGGTGGDTFEFRSVRDSRRDTIDTIRGTGGTDAFQGAGSGNGDIIDLHRIDANRTVSGNQDFRFGESHGLGRLWAEEVGNDTYILGNTDRDSAAEFAIRIEDELVLAEAYRSSDFDL